MSADFCLQTGMYVHDIQVQTVMLLRFDGNIKLRFSTRLSESLPLTNPFYEKSSIAPMLNKTLGCRRQTLLYLNGTSSPGRLVILSTTSLSGVKCLYSMTWVEESRETIGRNKLAKKLDPQTQPIWNGARCVKLFSYFTTGYNGPAVVMKIYSLRK